MRCAAALLRRVKTGPAAPRFRGRRRRISRYPACSGQNAGAWLPDKTRTGTTHLRQGHDTLKGGPGDDRMNSNMGTVILRGGPENDCVLGGQDMDPLNDGAGDATLWGDLEGDTFDCGPSADHLVAGNDARAGDGHVDHLHFATGKDAGGVFYGLDDHDVLWIDGIMSTRERVGAPGSRSSRLLAPDRANQVARIFKSRRRQGIAGEKGRHRGHPALVYG